MPTISLEPSHPDYPRELRTFVSEPPTLRLRGRLPRAMGVAVVGTREASEAGLAFAKELGATLASAGFAVWSGGALGIDRAAHEGALSVDGLTVLVAGGGLGHPYPKGADELYERVVVNGAVLGVVPDDVPPKHWIFHARNEVLAASTIATVVVECPIKSGTRNTTAHARRVGRPVFFFGQPPWSPFASALREEIRLGARVVLSIEDLLSALTTVEELVPVVPPVPRKRRSRAIEADAQELDAPQRRLLDALEGTSKHTDELCQTLGWTPAETSHVALALLLMGRIDEAAPGLYAARNGPKSA